VVFLVMSVADRARSVDDLGRSVADRARSVALLRRSVVDRSSIGCFSRRVGGQPTAFGGGPIVVERKLPA